MPVIKQEERTSRDGLRRIEFYRSDSGFFSFEESVWTFDDMHGSGLDPYHYWCPRHCSGLYASLDEARRGAASDISWYCDLTAS